ncbi:prolyl 4-hydroxylase [Chloropicon primus]|uniref:Prolyl 4-hydroxylase n=1 Tax=Chloropicon primus TaxID=1764295 RepID=A0A5B8MJ20_9CHLO|nr:prolyl 4-hydroxylase [Chloropicon primus]UPQ99608.1 prolyl 4-hydroxylase [Chloropicon primus]|eukprot:QDZ20399.1 prolyl 4-hydroxylase [Chloropicon primus]
MKEQKKHWGEKFSSLPVIGRIMVPSKRTLFLFLSAYLFVYYLLPKEFRAAEVRHSNHVLDETTFSVWEPVHGSNETWIEVMSWSPRAFVIHNWLTEEQADHLVELGRGNLERSEVVSGKLSETKTSKVRTSQGAFLQRYQTETVAHLQEKVSLLLGQPALTQEPLQILKYNPSEKYNPHFDAVNKKDKADGEPNRAVTILMYLSDVQAGGETNFPLGALQRDYQEKHGRDVSRETRCQGRYSEVSRRNSVRPKKTSALVFWDLDPSLVYKDMASLHEGCPVISGEKWSSTIWSRTDVTTTGDVPYVKDQLSEFNGLRVAGDGLKVLRTERFRPKRLWNPMTAQYY